jgi:hypothetical protein
VIKTNVVLTLRDLRGEHEPAVRTVQRWGVPWTDASIGFAETLIELAGVALEWRKDDRLDVIPPAGQIAPRNEAVLNFVKDIAKALAQGERISLYGADCSLMSWEPAA